MDAAQLSLAFTAGALAFLSPCALPMIPAYISYYISSERAGKRIARGLLQSLSMSAGFLLVFLLIGIIPSLITAEFQRIVGVSAPVLGVVLIIIGLLTSWTSIMDKLPRSGIQIKGGNKISFLSYGVAYGVASLGCNLPIFLLVVLQGASAKSLIDVAWLFAAYGAGAAALIIPLTITLTLAKNLLHTQLLVALPYLRRVNGVVLILAGMYMIYTGLTR